MVNQYLSRLARWQYLDPLCLAILVGISTHLLIGDLGVRLANTSSDEGLVAFSYFLKFPERFAQDEGLRNWAPAALVSMMNWLPALLFKYAGVPPEFFYGLFVYAQNILLALAMYRLAMVMTGSRESALISAIFTLAFRPHWWNMGLFADIDWMPYGAWLALPFLIYAGAYALDQRTTKMACMLLIGGLVHPILGLFAGAIFGGYWLLLSLQERGLQKTAIPLAALLVTVTIFLLPVIYAKLGSEEVHTSQMLEMILKNGHAIPWANPECSYCMPLFVRSLLIVPIIAALALVAARHPSMHGSMRLFMSAAAVVVCAACLLHFAAYLMRDLTLLRVIFSRSTILLLVFSVPPVVALAWGAFRDVGTFKRVVAGSFMMLPSPATGLSLLLTQPLMSGGGFGKWVARACHAAGAFLFVLTAVRFVPQLREYIDPLIVDQWMASAYKPLFFNYQSWGVKLPVLAVVISGLVFLALVWRSRHVRQNEVSLAPPGGGLSPSAACILVLLGVYLLFTNYKSGLAGTSGEAREYYEVQAWARTSTPETAQFVVAETSVYESWRNYTHRARVSPGGCGFYVCSKAGLERGREVSAFFAQKGYSSIAALDTNGLRLFAETFGGDYVVRRRSWRALELPVVFENEGYVVYALR